MIKLSVLFSGLWIYKVTLFLRSTGTHVAAALIKFPTRAPKYKRSTSALYLPAFLQLHMAQYCLLALPSLLYCGITPPGPHYSHHSIDLPTSDQSELWSRSQSSIQGWTSLSTRTHTQRKQLHSVHWNCSQRKYIWSLLSCYSICILALCSNMRVLQSQKYFSAHF